MNDYLILASLFICHILGDFYLQSQAMVNAKRFGQQHKPLVVSKFQFGVMTGHLIHIVVHALVMGIVLHSLRTMDVIYLSDANLFFAILAVALGHLAIDLLKSWWCCKNRFGTTAAMTLIVDQLAHLLWILIVWDWLFDPMNSLAKVITVDHLIIVGAYLLVLKPTSILVVLLLLPYNLENGDTQIPKAGKLIGYIERAVILTLIFVNQYTAIGFIIAAKSVLRYGESGGKNTKLNEYVLLGTLASFGIVLLVGILARFALGITM